MRRPFIAGNWKMNTDSNSGVELAKGIAEGMQDFDSQKVDVAFFPPFVYLQGVVGSVSASNIGIGGQDLYFEDKGAFTGEISAGMLKDVGCTYALCGHSERRHVIGESDELINKKLHAAVNGGLLGVLCVGETLAEREAEKTEEVITRHVKEGLKGFSADKVSAITIAYEPVWAIGTGLTATPDQAQDIHKLIRGLLSDLYNDEVAGEIRIQYGGSVKPGNAADLLAKEDIDGCLVGGASLKVDDFLAIIKAAI